VKPVNLREERVGAAGVNKHGTPMTVTEYRHTDSVIVTFDCGYSVETTWRYFKLGRVKNPYDRTVYGVGYLGEGKYKTQEELVRRDSPCYKTWTSMLQRCYSPVWQEKNPTYKGCSVAEEWHNFQNFAKWYEDNFYKVPGEVMHLDKDILVKGNKVYSKETCVFVPTGINCLILKPVMSRELPTGVSYDRSKGRYRAKPVNGGKSRTFRTAEEAAATYKQDKETYIKSVAESYKTAIPARLYKALIDYEVYINE